MARKKVSPVPDEPAATNLAARKQMFANAPGRQQMAMTTPKRNATISSSALRQISDDTAVVRRRRRNRSQTDRVWQREALDYTVQVGELGALLTMQANVVSLCAFPVRRLDANERDWVANEPVVEDVLDPFPELPKPPPAPVPPGLEPFQPPEAPKTPKPKPKPKAKVPDLYDDRPANVMRNLVGPDGGQVDLIRRAAFNVFCTGECTLLGTPHPKDTGILWEFLSVLECYPNADGAMVRRRGGVGSMEEPLPDDNYTARFFRSDISYSELATSEVKRVLPILQEIVNLTMMIDALVKSRVPANILFIPDGMSFASTTRDQVTDPTADPVADDSTDTDDLVDDLFDHMTAPFNDPGSAARLVPLVLTGDGEQGQFIKVIDLARQFDQFAQELRQEALLRLAQGLDAPPESMMGKGSVSHWTGANIDSELIVKHIQPMGILFADFLTWAYLRPMLEAYEEMTPEEAARFKVEFDPSPVIARADEAKSARDLAEWLSDEAIISANGFTKADMASGELVRQRRLWQLISTQPGQFAKLLPLLPGFENVDPESIGTPAPPPPPVAPPGLPGDPKADPTKADPTKPDQANKPAPNDGKTKATGDQVPVGTTAPRAASDAQTGNSTAKLSVLTERLVTASDAAVGLALRRAGSRVVSLSQSKAPEVRERIRSTKIDRVLSLVTVTELSSLGCDPKTLLKGAWDDLASQAREWVRDHLADNGMEAMTADDRAALTTHALCEALQALTLSKLSTPWRPGSNGLRVPNSLVNEILEQVAYAGAL